MPGYIKFLLIMVILSIILAFVVDAYRVQHSLERCESKQAKTAHTIEHMLGRK